MRPGNQEVHPHGWPSVAHMAGRTSNLSIQPSLSTQANFGPVSPFRTGLRTHCRLDHAFLETALAFRAFCNKHFAASVLTGRASAPLALVSGSKVDLGCEGRP